MDKYSTLIVIILAIVLLLIQALWIFLDAKKRGEKYYWLWGLLGLTNVPSGLIIYLIVTRIILDRNNNTSANNTQVPLENEKTKIKSRNIILLILFMLIIGIVVIASVTIGSKRNNQFAVGMYESTSSSRTHASYKFLSGTKAKSFDVHEGDSIIIHCKSEVEKGTLDIKIVDSKDNIISNLETNKKYTEKINVQKDDEYTLVITGDYTKGNYDISWEINN